jgi:hypothetical protein
MGAARPMREDQVLDATSMCLSQCVRVLFPARYAGNTTMTKFPGERHAARTTV